MAGRYVSLDLETTGLDPQADAIIEIGAVRFDLPAGREGLPAGRQALPADEGDDGVRDRFSTLVNPRRPIPPRIQALTGIGDEEVRGAPPLEVVAGELEEFLDGAVIVGHNVAGFDVRFLDAAGIRRGEALYDTQELAALLLPGLPEYSLAALAQRLGIDFPLQHRAPADAEAARLLFLALRRRAAALPPEVLEQVARWLAPTAWPWRGFFHEVWEEARDRRGDGAPFSLPRPPLPEPLRPRPRPTAVDPEEPLAVIASARARPDLLPAFEERAEQREMARAVCQALNQGERLLVEAGTGTGKSLAYLVPAACHALASGRRVVVSTATIGLQEQLTGKDIPIVQGLLAERGGPLRACQLKGRSNYLCLRRFAALRSAPALSDDEARIAARILIWLTGTETGDRAELRLSPAEERVWRRLSAEGAECTADNSPFVVEGTCFLQRARKRAEGSHIVVVNHALLLSDLAHGGRVLPPYDHLIIDEAHHLEEEATRQFGFAAGEGDLADLLDAGRDLAGAVAGALRGRVGGLGWGGDLRAAAQGLARAAEQARPRLEELSRRLLGFLRQHAPEGPDQEAKLLINRPMRAQPDWSLVEIAWDDLRLALAEFLSRGERLHASLLEGEGGGLVNLELLLADAAALLQRGRELVAGLGTALAEDDPRRIVWLERQRADGSVLVAWAPLEVGGILQERLYDERSSVVLTGATLTSPTGPGRGGFDYLRERLGLEDAQELALGSPFDYQRAALVLLPRDMPEPTWPDYLDALSRAIVELARASRGRALVLFTSRAALRAAYALVREPLRADGIEVLGQGIDGSPRHLVRALQADPRAVLLGTASFWEGVDLAGEALSLLVMTRLPFTVPTEPVFAARSALYDDPFAQYALPQAVLRFRQGFGRLIRSRSDRGVMVVLDQRIVSKSYGSLFLEALPPCSVREALLREMPALTRRWLDGAAVHGAGSG